MKRKMHLQILFGLTVVSVFLPWFTYNAKVMGYCWGFQFLKWMAVPLLLTAAYLFAPKLRKELLPLAECGMLVNMGVVASALGCWQTVCNITSGFHWKDGLHTALPTYWIAAALFLIFFVVFQADLLAGSLRKKETENSGV